MIADTERLKSTPKLSFDNGGEFIRQTRRDVEEYLSARGTRVRGRVQLYAKGVVALVVLLSSWLILMFGQPGVWLGLLSLGGMILGTSLIAFSVMHDANHGAYFQARRLNHLMGWTADALLGLSSYAWRVKHNVAHHTYTNVDGYDADITQVPFARLAPGQLPRPWYRLQHYYIWALYCVMALRWQTVGDIAAFSRGSIGTSALRMPRRWDLAGLIGGKVIFVSWAIVVPLLVYPWWAVLGAYLVYSMVVSLIMAVTFQLAHCVEEADFATAERARQRAAALGGARGRDDGRLLPAQPGSQLGRRRPQLPDRAPLVPPCAAHSLRTYRQDRPAQRQASRCPLRHASLVARSTPIALPTPSHDGTQWCPGHARDGLSLRPTPGGGYLDNLAAHSLPAWTLLTGWFSLLECME